MSSGEDGPASGGAGGRGMRRTMMPISRGATAALTWAMLLMIAQGVVMAQGRSSIPDTAVVRPSSLAGTEPGKRAQAGEPGVGRFAGRQPDWWASTSLITGSIERGYGPGLRIAGRPGGDVASRVKEWLFTQPELVAPGVAELDAGSLLPGLRGEDAVRWVRFQQTHQGLRVLRSSMSVAMRGDDLIYMASRAMGRVKVKLQPRLDSLEALQQVMDHAGLQDLLLLGEAELALTPRLEGPGHSRKLAHDLIWRLEVLVAGEEEVHKHHAWVDAHDGHIVAFFPDALSGTCTADPRQVSGQVTGGVRPNRADDPEVVLPLPSAPVLDGLLRSDTDLGGRFPYAGGPASSDLQGTHFKMICADCIESQPLATDDGTGRIEFGLGGGSTGPLTVGNGTSTPAERTAFYHLDQARRLLDKWDVGDLPDLRVEVNYPSACNAISGAYLLRFYQEGSGCHNTGEIRDVMQHELGHSWDRFDGNDITDGGMSEWKADMLALTMGGDSCIGESFRMNPAAGATAACSGVRDLDEKAAGRQDLPTSPTASCPDCPTLTRSTWSLGGCTGVNGVSPHCTGSIAGQSIWHLRSNLLTGLDYENGAPLPQGNPALSETQVRWLLERWLLGGGPPMETWDPLAGGVSIYDAIMVADDDDGNLANGTPHAAYINAALGHHEIAEASLVGDATNCSVPADPLLTAVAEMGPGGRPQVRIEWSGGGAGTFQVLRRRFAGDAFLPIARDVVAGPIFDIDVSAGETLEYMVLADSAVGCRMVSPGQAVSSVAIDLAELRARVVVWTEAPGDGDGLIEPGETAAIDLVLDETGGLAGASLVEVTLLSTDPGIAVLEGGPLAWGGVAAGASVNGPASFLMRLADDLPCGGTIPIQVAINAAETCTAQRLRLSLAVTCDAPGSAFVKVVPGSLQVIADTGDGDGVADNCELSTVEYSVQNIGSSNSGYVTTEVEALDEVSRVVGGEAWHHGNLAPGETITASFTVDLAGWKDRGTAGFSIQAQSVLGGGKVTTDLEMPVEEVAPVYTSHVFDFDDGPQGWVADGFALSGAQVTSGTQSFHAGSTSSNWLCQRLESPLFHLDPGGGASLTFSLYAQVEPFSGNTWWDRANVHLIEEDTGTHVLLTPVNGVGYNADPASSLVGQLCHIDLEEGWAGDLTPFGPVVFDLAPWVGRDVRIEINYSSDGGDDREGIYVDDVVVAGAYRPQSDLQSNACDFAPEVSPPGSPVPLEVDRDGAGASVSWEDLGVGFTYNVYGGSVGNWFDHGTAPLSCGGVGVICDGARCSWTQASLPAGQAYYVVTATRAGREGPSGFISAGAPRDSAANSCLP